MDLAQVSIGLAWRRGWKPNADGFLKAGHCKKRGDLDRALDEFDFVILLNAEAWPEMTEPERKRLVHHELCHAQVCRDANGEIKHDEKGRPVCRVRKHDIEEFFEVAEIYGLKNTLNQIAIAAVEDSNRPLLKLGKVLKTMLERSQEKAQSPSIPPTSMGETPHTEEIDLTCSGMKKAYVQAVIECVRPGGWDLAYDARLGNYNTGSNGLGDVLLSSRRACLDALELKLGAWLDSIELAGTAAQKKSLMDRRRRMKDQIRKWLDHMALDPAPKDAERETSDENKDGVPFEED